jgi:cystathionine beta-lyase
LSGLIVDYFARRHQWEISADDIIYLPGVTDGLSLACRAVGKAGDHVLIPTPVYSPFLEAPKKADQVPLIMELSRTESGRYIVDFDRFEETVTGHTSSFLLCNPHNPTGRVFSRQELERMAEICLRKGIVIISDDIHCDLVYSGHSYTPIAKIDPEIAAKTITLVAPSKTFNLAGLKFGAAIIQNKTLKEKFKQSLGRLGGFPYHISVFAITGAAAAYQHGEAWLAQMLPYLERNRDTLHKFVAEELPGIQMLPPEATFLAWLNCRGVEFPTPPADFFLAQARVGLSDGAIYGDGGEGFVRLNFACPRPVLMKALKRMRRALLSIQSDK